MTFWRQLPSPEGECRLSYVAKFSSRPHLSPSFSGLVISLDSPYEIIYIHMFYPLFDWGMTFWRFFLMGRWPGHFRSQIGLSWLGFLFWLFSRQLGSILSFEMKLWFFNDLLTVLGFWKSSKTVLFHSSLRVSFQLPPKNASKFPSSFSSLFTPGHVPYCRFVQIFGRGSNCIRRRQTAPIIVPLQVAETTLCTLEGLRSSPEALGLWLSCWKRLLLV